MIYNPHTASGPEYGIEYFVAADGNCPVKEILDTMPLKHEVKVSFPSFLRRQDNRHHPWLSEENLEDAAGGDWEGRKVHDRLATEESGMKGKGPGKRASFREDLKQRLRDPKFARAYASVDSEVRLAVAVAEARARAGLSQAELAKLLHTKQSNISRIERGTQNLTVATLRNIAKALHSKLEIHFHPV